MNEKPVVFGRSGSLLGVASFPDEETQRIDAPAVILLNAGILYRVGPNRLHVRLARALAHHGIMSFRFDLGGVGDSKIGPDETGTVRDIVMRDITDATDWVLQKNCCPGVVLVGLCAGADNAIQGAMRDGRVLGAVLIDPNTHRSTKSVMRRYGNRLFSRKLWRLVLTGRHPAFRHVWSFVRESRAESKEAGGNVFLAPTELPSRAEMEGQLRKMVDEGCHLFFVFAGEAGARYNHHDQLFESYPSLRASPRIRLDFHPGADHTFSQRAQQERLIESILSWVDSAVPWSARVRRVSKPRP